MSNLTVLSHTPLLKPLRTGLHLPPSESEDKATDLGVTSLRTSAFGTKDHNIHRRRREPLNKFFSRASVSKIERDLHSLAQQLGDKILSTATHKEVFEFQDAVSCYTSDVIGLFAFGDPLGFLQQRGFVPNLKRASWPMFTTYYICRWLEPVRYCFETCGA